MHIPAILQERFANALSGMTDEPQKYAQMIRGTNDASHGDYQANCAMPLSKQQSKEASGSNPRDLAESIVAALNVDDICEEATVAGPGFINLKVKDSFLESKIQEMLADERCLVDATSSPKNIVVDFSSPNVAKPMHVGHIRSTVIGDSLARTLSFLGHNVVTDNHLGDWGTQFGIIIYGYKHFGDPDVVKENPIPELSKLYRKVNQLIEYQKALKVTPVLQEDIVTCNERVEIAQQESDAAEKDQKKKEKALKSAVKKLAAAKQKLADIQTKVQIVDDDAALSADAQAHSTVDKDVLHETVKLHAGDEENLALWHEFLPHCKDEINRIYNRLNVTFDHTLGESFYHSMLGDVVSDLQERGLAKKAMEPFASFWIASTPP